MTLIVAPASVVPEIIGVLSVVVAPSTGAEIAGAPGAVASMVNSCRAEGGETLPAGSAAVVLSVWAPSTRSVGWTSDHVPPPVVAVVPITAPSMRTVTVLPASAVPL